MPHTLREAAKAVGRDRSTLVRAIRTGRLSATRDAATGAWLIEPAELHRVYPPEFAEGDAERTSGAAWRRVRPMGRTNGAQAAAQVEIRELRTQLAVYERTVDDLRRRLDAEAEERRRLTLVLADLRQRTGAALVLDLAAPTIATGTFRKGPHELVSRTARRVLRSPSRAAADPGAARHLDGVDAPRRHRCAKVVVLSNHHRGGVHGPG